MTLQATVSHTHSGQFIVFAPQPLSGRGIKYQRNQIRGHAHIVTAKAYEKLEKQHSIKFFSSAI